MGATAAARPGSAGVLWAGWVIAVWRGWNSRDSIHVCDDAASLAIFRMADDPGADSALRQLTVGCCLVPAMQD